MKKRLKTFEVRMECVVQKLVTCIAESKEQVQASPWEYAEDEIETNQVDWEILSIDEIN